MSKQSISKSKSFSNSAESKTTLHSEYSHNEHLYESKDLTPGKAAEEERFSLADKVNNQVTAEQVRAFYQTGLYYFRQGQLEQAADEFAKALRPVLSKAEMRSVKVDIEEVLIETLSSMNHLAEIYLQSGNYDQNYAKAAGMFQFCAAFKKEHKIDNDQDYAQKVVEVQERLIKDFNSKISSDNKQALEEVTSKYEKKLAEIEDYCKSALTEIKPMGIEQITERTQRIEEIYKHCQEFFVNQTAEEGFLQELINDVRSLLGAPPFDCKYSFIALGSLATGKMTPWSDLEFAILINEDKEEYKEYFKKFTELLQTVLISLNKTPIYSLGIEHLNNVRTGESSDNWFGREYTEKGLRFDSKNPASCKAPYGRQGGYKVRITKKDENGVDIEEIIKKDDYELISTPPKMASFLGAQEAKSDPSWYDSDKHLVHAMRTVSLISGSKKLLNDYKEEITKVENSELRQKRALDILKENLEEFSLKLGDEEEGKLFDVKQDIYRLGDRVIASLADYYGITPEKDEKSIDLWDMIDRLKEPSKLSKEGAEHLKQALAIALELRLNTYAHNDGQMETVSTYEPAAQHLSEEQKKQLIEKTFYIQDTKILHHFYYVMLRVQAVVKVFCADEYHKAAELFLEHDSLFGNNYHNIGLVHARFLEYDLALEYLRKAADDSPENLSILQDLFFLCRKTSQIEDSMLLANKMLAINKASHVNNPNHPSIAASYNGLANVHHSKGEYDLAIEYHQKALEIWKVAKSNPNHPAIATSYNNLAVVYNSKGEYELAIEYHQKALEMNKVAYSPNHPSIAASYNGLAGAYYIKGEYELAIEYHQKALEIWKVAKSNPNHPAIAASYNILAAVHKSKGEYELAIEYHQKALEIWKVAYKSNPNHPAIAASYNILAAVHKSKGEYELAIEYHQKALEIWKVAYKSNPNHPDIATSYNSLASAYDSKGEYELAIEYHNRALEMRKVAYVSSPNHPAIAVSYNGLANVHHSKGEYDLAIEYHQKALEMKKVAYKSNPNHPDIATSYNSLANVHHSKGEYGLAIEYHQKALEIWKVAYKSNPNHPDIATSYNSLANVHHSKGEYGMTIKYHSKALEIMKIVYANSPNHPDIAASYNNLAIAFNSKGEYELAIEYHQKALEMKKVAYASSPNHPAIAASYNGLANVHDSKGEYDLALEFYLKSFEMMKVVYATDPNHPDIATSYNNLAVVYNSKGEYELAIEYHNRALEMRKVAYASTPNHPDIAGSYNGLANVYIRKGEYDLAIEYHQKALEMRKIAYASNPNHPDIAASYNGLANVHDSKGEYDLAIKYHSKALEMKKVAYASTPNHPDIASSYHNLANAYSQKDQYDLALEYYGRVLEIMKMVYASNPNHPDIATSYNSLAVVYNSKGEYELAIEYHQKALEMKKVAYASSPNHPSIAASYNNLANAYSQKGEYDLALEFYLKSFEMMKVVYANAPNHPSIATSYNNLANACSQKGEYDLAIECYSQALEMMKIAYASSPNHPAIATSYNNLANAYSRKGEYDTAIEYYQKSLENQISFLCKRDSDSDFDAVGLCWNLVSEYYNQNKITQAIAAQKLLLSYDPDLIHGNHHHSLACYYAAIGKIELANKNFKNAFFKTDKITSALHIEYAQFLILHMEQLGIDPSLIADHLKKGIEVPDNGGLQYGNVEKDIVCPILQKLIQASDGPIEVSPKVLACYLVIKHADLLEVLIDLKRIYELMQELTVSHQDDVSMTLFADASLIMQDLFPDIECKKHDILISENDGDDFKTGIETDLSGYLEESS